MPQLKVAPLQSTHDPVTVPSQQNVPPVTGVLYVSVPVPVKQVKAPQVGVPVISMVKETGRGSEHVAGTSSNSSFTVNGSHLPLQHPPQHPHNIKACC
jgi:hypothetical protein